MISVVPGDLPHTLLFPICHLTIILFYCVVEISDKVLLVFTFLSNSFIIYPVLSFRFISHHPHHMTIFQFISRPKFSSFIVTHHYPSVENIIFFIRFYIYWLFLHHQASLSAGFPSDTANKMFTGVHQTLFAVFEGLTQNASSSLPKGRGTASTACSTVFSAVLLQERIQ